MSEVAGPLSCLEVTSARGVGACNNKGRYNNGCPLLCLYLCDQVPTIWRTGSYTPTLIPICRVQAAIGTHAQLPATKLRGGKWGAVTVQRAQMDQN